MGSAHVGNCLDKEGETPRDRTDLGEARPSGSVLAPQESPDLCPERTRQDCNFHTSLLKGRSQFREGALLLRGRPRQVIPHNGPDPPALFCLMQLPHAA